MAVLPALAALPKLFLLWLLITVIPAVKAFAFAPVPDEVAVRSLGWPLLMAALLVPYIKRSQRVKGPLPNVKGGCSTFYWVICVNFHQKGNTPAIHMLSSGRRFPIIGGFYF